MGNRITTQTKILILLLMIMLVLLAVSSAFYIIEKGKTKYYKEQMMNFCKLSSSQMELLKIDHPNINFPEFKECKYWILSYDGGFPKGE